MLLGRLVFLFVSLGSGSPQVLFSFFFLGVGSSGVSVFLFRFSFFFLGGFPVDDFLFHISVDGLLFVSFSGMGIFVLVLFLLPWSRGRSFSVSQFLFQYFILIHVYAGLRFLFSLGLYGSSFSVHYSAWC